MLLSLLIPCIETFVDMDRSWLFDVFERYGQLLLKAVMLLRLRAMLMVCVCMCVERRVGVCGITWRICRGEGRAVVPLRLLLLLRRCRPIGRPPFAARG